MTRLRGLVALVALAFAIGAVPWALVRFGNWPINGIPSSEQLRDLGDTVVSDTTVFAVLTVAAWLVWAVFTVSVLVETSAALRRVQAPRLAFAGPLQRSARGLVAAIVLAVTIQHIPPPAHAGASFAASFVQRSAVVLDIGDPAPGRTAPAAPTPVSAPAAVAPTAGVAEPADEVVVTVQHGDSAWSIAATHLGDGMRWRELWATNRGVTQPDGRSWTDPQIIRVGWQLRLPTSDTRSGPAAAPGTTAEPVGVVHTVVPGDTLSGIADTHLGDPARYTEILELNRDAEQPDGRRLTDPNLILPGWNLRLPDVATPPVSTPVPTSPEVVDPAPVPTTGTPTSETTPTTTTPTTTVPTTAVPAPTSIPTAPSSPATPSTVAPVEHDGDADPPENGWTTSAPTLAGIGGAVVLATGLALRIGFLRRRQATRGTRARTSIPTDSGETEVAVVAAADVPLVRWAGQQLAQLVLQLDRRRATGAPVAVELSDTAGIELLWDTPQPDAPDPWTIADGGWAWRLAYDPDAPVPADELPAAIPALVTIGHREGRQLLIDLEAYGGITVSGTDERVDAFLRSVAVELATDQDLADAYVHTVGFNLGIEHLDRLGTSDVDGAVRHLDGVRRSVTDALDVAQLDGTFAARAGSTTPIEATVVIARTANADETDRLLHAASARRGIAVIAVGDGGKAPAHIELRDDGTARLEPLGIVFTPVALPEDSATAVDELLDALDTLDTLAAEPDNAGQYVADAPPSNGDEPAVRGGGPPAPELGKPMADELFPDESVREVVAPAMLVRVLGTPAVPDRPDLGRRELILTVLLACRQRPIAASAAQDALWGGKPVEAKTVWNVIGATRKALGDFPDGTPVMPSADRARGTLRVAPGVVTDLAVLQGLVDHARQAPPSEAIGLLRRGLELVGGPPFDAAGYDWAHRDQDVAEASTLIEHATEQLVDLALDTGMVDVARDAIVRGLRGLPGNEELYRCRMRVEHHAGNLPGVSAAYNELVTYLVDLETEPSASTTALYQELVRPVRR